MRILVTGAGGFIGRSISQYLYVRGFNVTTLERKRPSNPVSSSFISKDVSELDEATLLGFDAVVHCAWSGNPGQRPDIWDEFGKNIAPTIDLFRKCERAGVKSFHFLSSGGTIYGDGFSRPIDEFDRTSPMSLYGTSKHVTESLLTNEARSANCRLIVARISNPHGPGQKPWKGQGVIATAFASSIAGKTFSIWGDGSPVRDYIFIDDLCEAMKKLCLDPYARGVFNIGTGIGTRLIDCINLVREISEDRLVIEMEPGRSVDLQYNVLSIERVARMFDWRPRTSLRDGLAITYRWLQDELASEEKVAAAV